MAKSYPYIEITKGKVIASRRWSDTHMEVYGRQNAPRFYTDVEQRQEIFVKDDKGNESRWYVNPDNVGFREGSNFVGVTGQETADQEERLLYVGNPDSGEAYRRNSPIVPKKETFHGFGHGFVVALILSAILAFFFAPLLAKVWAPEFTSTKQQWMPTTGDIAACPFGSTVRPDPKGYFGYYRDTGCPFGSQSLPGNGGCKCASSADEYAERMYALDKRRHDAKVKEKAEIYGLYGVLAGLIAGALVWLYKAGKRKEELYAQAKQLRTQYIAALDVECVLKGVPLRVTDDENMLISYGRAAKT